jgi:hypothetical protein
MKGIDIQPTVGASADILLCSNVSDPRIAQTGASRSMRALSATARGEFGRPETRLTVVDDRRELRGVDSIDRSQQKPLDEAELSLS